MDVRDVTEGTIQAVEKGRTGERYLLSGTWLSLPDLAQMIADLGVSKKNWNIFPYWLAEIGVPFLRAYAWMKNSDPLYTRESLKILKSSHRMISCEKAKKELGYNPRPLEETVRDTVEWFREKKYF